MSQTNSSVHQVWQQTCSYLQGRLSPAVYSTWILSNPLTEFEVKSDVEAVGVITSPTAFHATNLKKILQTQLQEALFQVTGKKTVLEFRVGLATPRSDNSKTNHSPTPRNSYEQRGNNSSQNQSSFSPIGGQTMSPRVEELFSPATMQSALISQAEFQAKKAGLRLDYVFKTFAVSTTNEMAHAAATAVSQSPGHSYNPLFLYGGVGVGKTHLMQAIGNNIVFNNPQVKILYCTGEEFTNEIVSAIQTKKAFQFKEKYRNVQVLLIDDIQFIAGKNAVQEEFFHTFNTIIRQSGQIVLTSDRPPHEITLLEDRLRSRFEAGLMIDIQQPSFELRTAILLIKAKAHSLAVPMEIAQLIASKVDSARRIEGIITSLRSEVELKGKTITRELVETLLKMEHKDQKERKLRVPPTEIIKAVGNHYHIKQIVLRGSKRHKAIVRARHVAMFLLKEELGMPFTEIGRWFSNRDHTSAMHACEKIEKQLGYDDQLHQEVSAIRMSLTPLSR